MALQDKYDAALRIVREHNEAMKPAANPGDLPVGHVDPDTFLVQLKMSGGTSEERLRGMSYEDILAVMPVPVTKPGVGQVKPVALARDIARVFRDREEAPEPGKGYVSAKKVERMQPRELVDVFDPEEPDSPAGKRLREMSRGEPFVVYREEGGRVVDAGATLALLLEVKKGYDGRHAYQARPGDVRPVYRVGELPADLVDENPLYRGRPLRPDGTCDQTGRSWEGVPLATRQLVRLVIDSDEVGLNIDKANDLIDLAIDRDGKTRLVDRYQKAAVRFAELERRGELPKLRVPLKVARPGGGPLPAGRRVDPRG